jgi:hypothetical protein
LTGTGLVLAVIGIAAFGILLAAGLRIGRLILCLLIARIAGSLVALARLAASWLTGLIVAVRTRARLFAIIAGRFAARLFSTRVFSARIFAARILAGLILATLIARAGLWTTHRIAAGLLAHLAAGLLLIATGWLLIARLLVGLRLSAWLPAVLRFVLGRGLPLLLSFALLTFAWLLTALLFTTRLGFARRLAGLRLLALAVTARLLIGLRLASRLTIGFLLTAARWLTAGWGLLARLGLAGLLLTGLWLASLPARLLLAAGLVLAARHGLAGLTVGLARLAACLWIGRFGLTRPLCAQRLFVLAAGFGLVGVFALVVGTGWRLIRL